jgi:Domain of unknown function (DUF4381)
MKADVCIRRAVPGGAWSLLLSRTTLATAAWTGAAWPVGALAEAAEDIRDIRGPKAVATGSWLIPALIAGVIVVAVGAYVVRRRRHRATPVRILTLSEQTLARLEETRPLMRPATAREFGIAASEVIRNYIEKRFDVIATQRTTEEFLQTLLQSSNETLARHRLLLAQFLQQCDFVKFAGTSLAVADIEALFQSARSFVLETGEPPPVA